ncbi:hypothetical protein ACFS07_09365 [Undibacterium arcticum]
MEIAPSKEANTKTRDAPNRAESGMRKNRAYQTTGTKTGSADRRFGWVEPEIQQQGWQPEIQRVHGDKDHEGKAPQQRGAVCQHSLEKDC